MSTGGLVARETADEIGKWKKELGEWSFEKMMGRISSELLKSRARLLLVNLELRSTRDNLALTYTL